MSDPVLELLRNIREDLHIVKSDMSSMLEKHDKRIDDLEDSQAQMRGAGKVAIAVITGLSGIISWVISHVWKV